MEERAAELTDYFYYQGGRCQYTFVLSFVDISLILSKAIQNIIKKINMMKSFKCHIVLDNGRLTTKFYDKHDEFTIKRFFNTQLLIHQ